MLKMSGSIGEMGIQLLIGFLVLVVGANIIFAILFCIVLAKMVSADARATTGWRELCTSCRERLGIIATIFSLFGSHEKEKEDQGLMVQANRIALQVEQLQASAELYINPGKTGKFQTAQAEFGNVITRLVKATDKYPYLMRKHEYIVARTTLDSCEERLEAKVRNYNFIAKTCNKLKQSFPGPLVAGMMRFGDKAIIEKEFAKPREKFDPKISAPSSEEESEKPSETPPPQ